MSRSSRASTLARRDAGLRRLRVVNRMLIGTAVAGTGLLTDVAAHAFPGHSRKVVATRASARVPAASARDTIAHHHRSRHRRRRVHHALRPPAQPPTTSTQATTSTPAPTTTQVTTASPAPAPAPQTATTQAPVTSGGS